MDKAQKYADEFTTKVMAAKYGKRFTELENIEEDEELNRVWEYLNEEFYELIAPLV